MKFTPEEINAETIDEELFNFSSVDNETIKTLLKEAGARVVDGQPVSSFVASQTIAQCLNEIGEGVDVNLIPELIRPIKLLALLAVRLEKYGVDDTTLPFNLSDISKPSGT